MPKHSSQDNIMMRPLPSARVPWLVIFFLIAAMVLIYMGFLRPAAKLLGPPLKKNQYQQYVLPKKKPASRPVPRAATPPASAASQRMAP